MLLLIIQQLLKKGEFSANTSSLLGSPFKAAQYASSAEKSQPNAHKCRLRLLLKYQANIGHFIAAFAI